MVMPYHLHMPSYFLETFTEYPYLCLNIKPVVIIFFSYLSVFKVIPSWYHKYKNSYWFFQGIRKKNREWNFKEK